MAEMLAVAFEGHPIRVTNETPKRVAVLDVFAAMDYADPKKSWHDLQRRHPELVGSAPTNSPELVSSPATYSFGGRGRPTPVMGEQQILQLLMVLEGPKAAAFREWASSILIRYLKGDRSLADEIHLRADILGEEDEPVAPPLKAHTPQELADLIENAAISLFADQKWGMASELFQVALRYRTLPSNNFLKKAVPKRTTPPTQRPHRAPGKEVALDVDVDAVEEQAEAAAGSLESRYQLLLGWQEITRNESMSVWQALLKYRYSPQRFPKFAQVLADLGFTSTKEALSRGDELEQVLEGAVGRFCYGLWLSQRRGKGGNLRFRVQHL